MNIHAHTQHIHTYIHSEIGLERSRKLKAIARNPQTWLIVGGAYLHVYHAYLFLCLSLLLLAIFKPNFIFKIPRDGDQNRVLLATCIHIYIYVHPHISLTL